jgi:ribosome maturation protein SDO1
LAKTFHEAEKMSFKGGEIRKTFDLGKYIIAKLMKGKKSFEMIADPDEAWKAKKLLQDRIKEGGEAKTPTAAQILKDPEITLTDIFPTFDIFADIRKAVHITETELMEAFETTDPQLVAAWILLEGEFAWTKTQRDQWLEKKRKQIVAILARNSINPQTKKPHPPQRIEKALEEAHVSIDVNRTAEEQIDDIVRKIQVVIPIRIETIQMAVKVPAVYAAKAFNTVEKYAHIKQSEWANDGSWLGMVEMPAGIQTEFLEKLNNITHGRVQTKLVQN